MAQNSFMATHFSPMTDRPTMPLNMAAPLQPSWLSSTSPPFSSPPGLKRFYLFKPPSSLAPHRGPDSDSEESPSPGPSPPAPAGVDPVKLAFERAKAYKMTSQQSPGGLKIQTGNGGSGEGGEGGRQIALDKAGENLINEGNSDAGKVSNGKFSLYLFIYITC